MDRLDSMKTALQVARAGSLSAAARQLHMPVATVSRRVSDLEQHLGAQLFTRASRRLTPTAAGETYLATCQRILDEIGEAERLASGEYQAPVGNLTVTAPIAFGQMHVLPVALDFLDAYPQIDLRMVFTERALNLMEDQVDVALRIGPLPDSQLHARPIGRTRRVVCASPAYLARWGEPKTLEDLAGHDGITLQSIASLRGWTFALDRREVTAAVHHRLAVNTTQAAIGAAVRGVGLVRVLKYQVAEAIRAGQLHVVLERFEPEPWPIHLVYAVHGSMPLKVRAFLDWAAPRLKARVG